MAAIRMDRHHNVLIYPTVRRRLTWLLAAVATAWMTATIAAVIAVMTGITPATIVIVITVATTAVLATVLYRRFRRLGQVDEPLVMCLLVCWAVALGLLSL